MSRAIELAKECFVYGELVGEMPEYYFLEDQLEAFYQRGHREIWFAMLAAAPKPGESK